MSERDETEKFTEINRNNMMANLTATRRRSVFGPVIDLINNLGLTIVIVFGAWQVMSGEPFTIGAIAAFLSYLRIMQDPVRSISRFINVIYQSAAGYERITELMKVKPQVTEKSSAYALPPIRGAVKFADVQFSYQKAHPVFKHFNLQMEAGKVTALVGSSGAGKSTVIGDH
ncbi:ABC transporter ATP-binding protein [Terrilactibacillus sp. S3-3]|nr:ABC transporter ATP-binding protein [Terrilactibacillus sp. S3-3]